MAELIVRLSSKGSGISRNEDWWYLIFDTDTGELFIDHEYDYLGVGHGTKRTPLALTKGTSDAWLFALAVDQIRKWFGDNR